MPSNPDDFDTPARFRPKKARRHSRRRGWRRSSYALQLLGAALAVAFTLFLGVLVIEKAAHPYWLGHQVGQQVATLKADLRAQQQRNDFLRQKVLYLTSDEGAEVIARRHFYRRPGEQVLLLPSGPAAATARPQAARAARQQP